MPSSLDALSDTKTILLTTYRADGTPVSTPVSIAFADGRAFFRTWDTAWKTKRLARDPRVQVSPCTLRGQPTGPAIDARARLLAGEDARLAARALSHRHPFLHRHLVPAAHRLLRYRTVHYELTACDGVSGRQRHATPQPSPIS
jgi:uncharacterized protein